MRSVLVVCALRYARPIETGYAVNANFDASKGISATRQATPATPTLAARARALLSSSRLATVSRIRIPLPTLIIARPSPLVKHLAITLKGDSVAGALTLPLQNAMVKGGHIGGLHQRVLSFLTITYCYI